MARLVELPTTQPVAAGAVPWKRLLTLLTRDYWALTVAAIVLVVFLLLPIPLSEKLRTVLHGLCAQRLSHTYLLGDLPLPFDARMTGIYGGFIISFVVLLARGRVRAWGMLSWPVLALLLGFVGVMGIDGVNSTLLDLGLWHPYSPRNDFRLVTGALTGIALAVLLVFLLATTLWRFGQRQIAVVGSPREIAVLVAAQLPFVLAVSSGFGLLYAPISLLLLLAALTALTAMSLAAIAILRKRDLSYRHWHELQPALLLALAVAIVIVVGMAMGRFALEARLDIPAWL